MVFESVARNTHSKFTATGQVSIPTLRDRYFSEDVHRVLFPKRGPKPSSLAGIEEGIRRYARTRHARH